MFTSTFHQHLKNANFLLEWTRKKQNVQESSRMRLSSKLWLSDKRLRWGAIGQNFNCKILENFSCV